MSVHIHFDRPAGFLVWNLSQEITGWLSAPERARKDTLQFFVDGEPIAAECYRREDVEQSWRGRHVVGWTVRLDAAKTFRQPQRTFEFCVRFGGGQWSHSKRFYKSRSLMPVGRDSPLYFMHIPKTAGTALRAYIDYAFDNFPSLLVYGDPPGVKPEEVSGAYRQFAASRELLFGHFDFDLTRRLGDLQPKVVTVFRPPQELVRSYLDVTAVPVAEYLDNPLVRHVCGLSYTPPFGLIGAEHYELALELIDRYFHVLQQERLQEFANELSGVFGLQKFTLPRMNVTSKAIEHKRAELPTDLTFDTKLYDYCISRSRSFVEFLDT